VQKLETARQAELAAFNQAVAQGQFDLVKVRWGVDIPSDSPVERAARLQKLLQRPEAQRVRWTVEGGFLLVCGVMVLFKLLSQNKSLEFYLSEEYQGIWRRYRKGTFDLWLHPLDRSTSPSLLSPLELVQWHETALPRLRRAAQVEEEVRSAREAEQEVRMELATTRAEFEKYRSGYLDVLKQLYEARADFTELDQDIFALEQLYASEKQKPATSKEHFELLSKLQEVLNQQRGVLRARRREAEMLHFEQSGLVKSYNGLAAQVEALEAEVARKRAERERLEESVRQVRAELAAVPFEREKARGLVRLGLIGFLSRSDSERDVRLITIPWSQPRQENICVPGRPRRFWSVHSLGVFGVTVWQMFVEFLKLGRIREKWEVVGRSETLSLIM